MAKGQHHQVGTGGLMCPVLSSPLILNTTGTILSLEWFFWPASSSLLEEVLSSWCALSTWAKSKSHVLCQALFMYQSEWKGVRSKGAHHLSFLVFEIRLHYVLQAALELTVATDSKMFQLHKYCNYMCITHHAYLESVVLHRNAKLIGLAASHCVW